MLNVLTEAGSVASAIDFSQFDLGVVVPTFMAAVAVAIPVAIAIKAAKKGLAALFGQLGKA